jgi:serine protease Do
MRSKGSYWLALGLAAIGSLCSVGVAAAKGGWLGVELQSVDSDLREALDLDEREGVLIANVIPDGPADRAGIEEGDVVLKMDGQDVTSTSRFARRLRNADPGDTVQLELISDGARRTVSVVLTGDERAALEPPLPPAPPATPRLGHRRSHLPRAFQGGPVEDLETFFQRPRLGVTTRQLDEDLASYFGVRPGEGVVVLEVMDDTPAEKAGMKTGDVIVRVDGETIGSPAELRDVLLEQEGEEVSMEVRRHNEVMTVRATLESPRERWTSRAVRRSGRPDDRDELRDELEALRDELKKLREEVEHLRRD